MSNILANLPKYSLWAALASLLWFAFAVFGPKFGIIDWQTGFLTMVVGVGPILLGVVALLAVIAFAIAFFRRPPPDHKRGQWWKAAIALAIPVVLFGGLMAVRAQGASVPPIHDVSTDLRNPPAFSSETLAARQEWGANPLSDYGTPLGEMEMWAERVDADLAAKNHADIIAEEYTDLQPIVLGDTSREEALDAIVAAMGEIGLQDVRRDAGAGRVEGVAETFAFGFRDDVVARVDENQIDIRSVSRVGMSDLGYNADRVEALSDAIRERLGK